MNLLLTVILIGIINFILIKKIYNITDKNYYKCSKGTHLFGYVLGILIVAYILYLYHLNILTFKNDFITYFTLLIISLGFSIIHFHYNYKYNHLK
jgi:hypothetical protein